ncbi:hypothetical protein GUITHDRAFT_151268 [Guillardia theta CCMP2712]|uniref:Uncharacterized protein n=1 Tax=Guillardia theta (strain CCMP2712) TaxID=905079 RepID=L1JPV5_GUITC|nr:hypothetical protein GUITHDRAFT_151268 [Guillardia theta CCMP2712]EKX50279.1 hypothetical protein GUITHDRAFT_151268 [Guillardia theta CCMP2712]|eukprot:XP_005837259.1 hypothetical protein GUITHDRAFT_151268 [Guillardia theta CCMP2712]
MNKYWTGYNTNARVISPSQPTFISVSEPSSQATVTVRSFLPGAMGTGKEKSPEPLDRKVMIKRRPGGIFAVKRILTQPDPLDEWISTEQVYDIRAQLLDRLTEEGVKTRQDFKVARFANVYGPGDIRYELWVPVQSFEMRAASLISASNTSKISGLKLDFSLLDEEE